jgi:hypothetical protein
MSKMERELAATGCNWLQLAATGCNWLQLAATDILSI